MIFEFWVLGTNFCTIKASLSAVVIKNSELEDVVINRLRVFM